jgi:predicted MFS family arabinose efflux permease
MASSAVGSFIGAALDGFLADSSGFSSINWMAAIAGGLAVLLTVLWLAPASKQLSAEQGVES